MIWRHYGLVEIVKNTRKIERNILVTCPRPRPARYFLLLICLVYRVRPSPEVLNTQIGLGWKYTTKALESRVNTLDESSNSQGIFGTNYTIGQQP